MRRDVQLHEVRLDQLEVDGQPGLSPRLGEPPRSSVVVGEPVDVVIERIQPGGSNDAGLAHRTAEAVLLHARSNHQVPGAGDEGAERTAEPLGKAERRGVEPARDLRHSDTGRNGSVHEACTVEVHAHPELASGRDDRLELVQRPDRSTGGVVGVLERQDGGPRSPEATFAPARFPELIGRQPAPVPREAARLEPRVERGAAELGDHDVCALLDEELEPRSPRIARAIWLPIVAVGR